MIIALRNSFRFICPISAALIALTFLGASPASASAAESATPSGQAMEALIGVPYALFARQRDTEAYRSLNCFTAAMYALRRAGYRCPAKNFKQGWAFWWPRAQPLRLGESTLGQRGALMLTRSHVLLLHADRNGDGRIDGGDTIIHAYFRPVAVETLADWLRAASPGEIRVLPLDEALDCSPPSPDPSAG